MVFHNRVKCWLSAKSISILPRQSTDGRFLIGVPQKSRWWSWEKKKWMKAATDQSEAIAEERKFYYRSRGNYIYFFKLIPCLKVDGYSTLYHFTSSPKIYDKNIFLWSLLWKRERQSHRSPILFDRIFYFAFEIFHKPINLIDMDQVPESRFSRFHKICI